MGSCTHVWNYEQTTAFLFGELAMTMRDVEFAHATRKNGMMSFRVGLPLDRAKERKTTAADGQMGCVMKMYRDWQLSGDDKTLKRLWPMVRKALEYCWIPGGWDADRDGVMEGCQHNTMDVEYYGPNPLMTGWYLGALRAAEEMARYLGEEDFAAREGKHFWSNGYAWGACRIRQVRKAYHVELTVLYGALKLKRFVLTGAGETTFTPPLRLTAERAKKITIR